MKNSTYGFALFSDTESFLSELSIQEESLLSGGGCGSNKSSNGKPVVVGTAYGTPVPVPVPVCKSRRTR